MFHDRTITSLHEKYLQEQIDCDMGDLEELTTPAPLISLIDKQVSYTILFKKTFLTNLLAQKSGTMANNQVTPFYKKNFFAKLASLEVRHDFSQSLTNK